VSLICMVVMIMYKVTWLLVVVLVFRLSCQLLAKHGYILVSSLLMNRPTKLVCHYSTEILLKKN